MGTANCHIKVKVFPEAPEERVFRTDENSFRIFLREPAKSGLANRRLLEVLSLSIEPKPKRMRIVSGEHSPSKIIKIEY
ncbi:MAG: DUF167 domain-containing protein [Candidatus Taylorbacteria bacterium]|nr:DUF167 domain-containing protein [Candidatus Taylorbacteria bacterium]